jgi:choline dehydrogenase-like flavoprotein
MLRQSSSRFELWRSCSFFVQAARAVLFVVSDVSPPHLRQAAFDGVRGEELLPGPGVRTAEQLRRWVREHVDTGYHPTSVSAPHRLLCRPAAVVVAAAAAAVADDRQSVLCAAAC